MPEYIVAISDGQNAILSAVAEKDGKKVEQIIAEQLDYYLSVVVGDYLRLPDATLDKAQQDELDARVAQTKSAYIAEISAVSTKVTLKG